VKAAGISLRDHLPPVAARVVIVSRVERLMQVAEAQRLVGAHRASVHDEDPLAPVVVAARLTQPVIVASGAEASDFRRDARPGGSGDLRSRPWCALRRALFVSGPPRRRAVARTLGRAGGSGRPAG
jgi:hypothetical protein